MVYMNLQLKSVLSLSLVRWVLNAGARVIASLTLYLSIQFEMFLLPWIWMQNLQQIRTELFVQSLYPTLVPNEEITTILPWHSQNLNVQLGECSKAKERGWPTAKVILLPQAHVPGS